MAFEVVAESGDGLVGRCFGAVYLLVEVGGDQEEEVACFCGLKLPVLVEEQPQEDLVGLVGLLELQIGLNTWSQRDAMKYFFNGCLLKDLQASDQNLATHVKSGKSVITRCRSEDVAAQDTALMIKDRDRVVVDLCFVCHDWLPQIPDTNGLIK